MLVQARWDEMREKMQVVKNAYTSRHYTQCAKYGEQLLAEMRGEIHPIHLAHLNFYTALSHDTLAREATLKNRYKELILAEKHYLAAIAALTPGSIPSDNQRPSSPASTTSESYIWKFRRPSNAGSFDSTTSSASSATSYSDTDFDMIPRPRANSPSPNSPRVLKLIQRFNSTPTPPSPSPPPYSPQRTPSISPSRPTTPQEHRFAVDIAAFVHMVRNHLANVQAFKRKTSIPSVRFSFPSPPPSASALRGSEMRGEGDAMERVRRERKARTFRKRFDPESVQRLCNEALAELT
ncbi:hypothetical protein GQ44DRAFT_759664 [Phaeosphaeriaceae sp. PMI808]|nr:hypothetical protein GQ44DRAFT_759664 [Phaeosphaeriaceae sp. PMI808]